MKPVPAVFVEPPVVEIVKPAWRGGVLDVELVEPLWVPSLTVSVAPVPALLIACLAVTEAVASPFVKLSGEP